MTSPEQESDEVVIPDNPLVDGDTEYSVRLIFRVNANDPEHARTRFIAMMNEFGMNTWTYRVTETETGDEWLVRDGDVLTPEEFAEREAEEEGIETFLREEGFIRDDDDADGDDNESGANA